VRFSIEELGKGGKREIFAGQNPEKAKKGAPWVSEARRKKKKTEGLEKGKEKNAPTFPASSSAGKITTIHRGGCEKAEGLRGSGKKEGHPSEKKKRIASLPGRGT